MDELTELSRADPTALLFIVLLLVAIVALYLVKGKSGEDATQGLLEIVKKQLDVNQEQLAEIKHLATKQIEHEAVEIERAAKEQEQHIGIVATLKAIANKLSDDNNKIQTDVGVVNKTLAKLAEDIDHKGDKIMGGIDGLEAQILELLTSIKQQLDDIDRRYNADINDIKTRVETVEGHIKTATQEIKPVVDDTQADAIPRLFDKKQE